MNKRRILLMIGIVILILLSGCAALSEGKQESSESGKTTSDGVSNSSDAVSQDSEELRSEGAEPYYKEFKIVTLLPKDAIPAIDDPRFLSADEADSEYEPEEQVIGVNIDGEARAYSTGFLSRHEIVNDTVGGRKIAVTW